MVILIGINQIKFNGVEFDDKKEEVIFTFDGEEKFTKSYGALKEELSNSITEIYGEEN